MTCIGHWTVVVGFSDWKCLQKYQSEEAGQLKIVGNSDIYIELKEKSLFLISFAEVNLLYDCLKSNPEFPKEMHPKLTLIIKSARAFS